MCAKSKTGKTSRKARPDKVKEKAEIAAFRRAIGVSEPTFADWRRMPGAPVTLDVEQWRAFIVENGLGVRGSRPMPAREAHLTDNVARRNRLLELEIQQKEGKLADRSEVDTMLTRMGSLQKTILYAKLERELPAKAVGRSAEEIATLGREFADELCAIFARGVEEWQNVG